MSGFVGPISGLKYPLTQTAFDNTQAGVNQQTSPTWLVGQTITAQPNVPVPVTSLPQAQMLFGAASHLARMFGAYFDNDSTGPIWCVPYADATGSTAATGTITFTGPATGNGTIFLYIAGQLVQVGVTSAMTATQIATATVAAIAAITTLPVSATSAAGVVTLTALNKGTLGNQISVMLNYLGIQGGQTLPAGIAVAITAMTGGATDPALTGLSALLGDLPMRFMVQPWANATVLGIMAGIFSFNSGRWAPNRKTWGHHWTSLQGSVTTLTTFVTSSTNDPHGTLFGYETGGLTPPWEAAAAYAGACAPSIRSQPNLPLQYLQINGLMPPPQNTQEANGGPFGKTSWNLLLNEGVALAQYGANGTTPMVLRAPTLYTTNAAGQPDQSYYDTGTMYTLMAIADALNSFEAQQWARVLLVDDGTPIAPGIPNVSPSSARAALMSVYLQLQNDGLVEDASAFLAALTATRNLANPNELDILYPPFLVMGLIQVNNTIQFRNYSAAAAAVIQATAS